MHGNDVGWWKYGYTCDLSWICKWREINVNFWCGVMCLKIFYFVAMETTYSLNVKGNFSIWGIVCILYGKHC